MHPHNIHNKGYQFSELVEAYAPLKSFIIENKSGKSTIDFANPEGVKALNKALLKAYYDVKFWDIPKGYLCPPVPGRADYLWALYDLIQETTNLSDKQIKGLDLGTGANIIYPLIGRGMFEWQFVGTEVDDIAIENGIHILKENKIKPKSISIRKQENPNAFFKGIFRKDDYFTFCMCNPPFHKSAEEARKGSQRKVKNLTGKSEVVLNFGGQNSELWCKGGELSFITSMMSESVEFKDKVVWFTSLVSKHENVRQLLKHLKSVGPSDSRIIDMGQGQKKSRLIAWTFIKNKK